MRKNTYLLLGLISLSSCYEDVYVADERIIIEGTVISSNADVEGATLSIIPVYTENYSENVFEVYIQNLDYSSPLTQFTLDKSGRFTTSVPRNIDENAYVVSIRKGDVVKTYGYISAVNSNNYYRNLGTLFL